MTIELNLYLETKIERDQIVISLMRAHDQGDFIEASTSISRADLRAFLKEEPDLTLRRSATP
jgi:hypothetical protein